MLKIKCHVHLFQREIFFLPSATGIGVQLIRKDIEGGGLGRCACNKKYISRTTSPFTRNLYICTCRSYNVIIVPILPEGTNTEIQILKFNIGI